MCVCVCVCVYVCVYVLYRAQEEVKAVLDGRTEITPDDLADMKYIEKVKIISTKLIIYLL